MPTNYHCWCQKTRVIAVSCGIKISAVHDLVLSQYTRLTDGQTNGHNCDSNTVRCITMQSHGKKRVTGGISLARCSANASGVDTGGSGGSMNRGPRAPGSVIFVNENENENEKNDENETKTKK